MINAWFWKHQVLEKSHKKQFNTFFNFHLILTKFLQGVQMICSLVLIYTAKKYSQNQKVPNTGQIYFRHLLDFKRMFFFNFEWFFENYVNLVFKFQINKTKDPCDTNTCSNRGTCNITTGKCECTAPFYDDQCQTSKCFLESFEYFVYYSK